MGFDFNLSADRYDEWYDTPHGKFIDEIQQGVIAKYLQRLPSNVILEIGSGTGHWSAFMGEKGYFVLGVDIAQKLIDIAQAKNIRNASFLNGDVMQLPYITNTIENVVAITALEFVDDREKAFSEIFRVLKPGGGLIVGGLNKNGTLAEARRDHPGFKNANLFTYESLFDILSEIGKPEIEGCTMLPFGYKNLDAARMEEDNAGVSEKMERGNFLLGFVIKN